MQGINDGVRELVELGTVVGIYQRTPFGAACANCAVNGTVPWRRMPAAQDGVLVRCGREQLESAQKSTTIVRSSVRPMPTNGVSFPP